jgi:hypothetical protein
MNSIRSSVISNRAAILESLDLGIETDQEPDLAAALSANKDRANKSKTRVIDKTSWIDLGYRFEAEPSTQAFENAVKSDFPKHATVSYFVVLIDRF